MTSGQNISHYATAKLSVYVWNHDLIWWQNKIDTQKHFHNITITSSWTLSKTKIPITIVKAQMPSNPNQKSRTRDNQLSSNNSHHTSCIHKGLNAGKWPDLMTPKADSVSTLGYLWTDHTGRPLEPQVDRDATWTTLADATTHWCSSGDPMLICIIGTYWKTTRATSTLGCHWNHTGWC